MNETAQTQDLMKNGVNSVMCTSWLPYRYKWAPEGNIKKKKGKVVYKFVVFILICLKQLLFWAIWFKWVFLQLTVIILSHCILICIMNFHTHKTNWFGLRLFWNIVLSKESCTAKFCVLVEMILISLLLETIIVLTYIITQMFLIYDAIEF